MNTYEFLNNGDKSEDEKVKIVDQDRLCYVVRLFSRGSYSLRTISKELLREFIDYFREHPDDKADDARYALSGKSDLDKFEYGYAATLKTMAEMALKQPQQSLPATHRPRLSSSPASFQQIFYGAPGTGKSYTINHTTQEEDVIRTTFHPDSDYSTFVGAYKPTTIEETVIAIIGTQATPVKNPDGSERTESKIIYEFVAQAFLQAYVKAWKKMAMAEGEPQKQFLVIEEINRGNCAQIFGDLFQLLDRNESGFSDYPIQADADMKQQLKKAFAGLSLPQKETINAMYKGRNVADEVMNGDILLLPGNLYIWATMNTSDQSLFPIDSAFKRRWDWTYMPISNAHKDWVIEVEGSRYDWWSFLEKINEKIAGTTYSEDKKLGYFFCKADSEGIISAEKFVSKVVFYLWNDVFKDYELNDAIFKTADGQTLTFDKFYTPDGKNAKVITENVAFFLQKLGVEASSREE